MFKTLLLHMSKSKILKVFIFLNLIVLNQGAFCKFTNLKCLSYDKRLLFFKTCHIKAVSRDDSYIKIHALLGETARSGLISVRLLKRANGWKPFLYNISIDACKFMRNPKANPVGYFFYNLIAVYTNLNHTCPYEKEIFMDQFRISEANVKLPFPVGEYALDTVWRVNGKLWARVNGSCIGDVELR